MGNPVAQTALERCTPNTFGALQHFVMSMDDYVKNTGKKSIFGRDKGEDAYVNFLHRLKQTMFALHADNQINASNTNDEILEKIEAVMALFQESFPNWTDAYLYFAWISTENRQNTLSLIDRLRRASGNHNPM